MTKCTESVSYIFFVTYIYKEKYYPQMLGILFLYGRKCWCEMIYF